MVIKALPRGSKVQFGTQAFDLAVTGPQADVLEPRDSKRFEFWTPSTKTRFGFSKGVPNLKDGGPDLIWACG